MESKLFAGSLLGPEGLNAIRAVFFHGTPFNIVVGALPATIAAKAYGFSPALYAADLSAPTPVR